jgi:hypothetical protein
VDISLPFLLPPSSDDDSELSKESRVGLPNGDELRIVLPGASGVGESERGADDDAGDPNMNCIALLLADSTSSFACLNCHRRNHLVSKVTITQ